MVADHHRNGAAPGGKTAVVVQPLLFWELMDPYMCHMRLPTLRDEARESVSQHTEVEMTTHHTHQLGERGQDASTFTEPEASQNDWLFDFDSVEQVYMDELFSQPPPLPMD